MNIKIKKSESVHQIINTHFNLKAKPWQVNAIMNITKCKKNIYAIVDINASKSLVYWLIPFVIDKSILVILSTITFI